MSLLLIVPESYFQNVIVIFWLFTWGKYWNSSLSSPFVQRCCEPKQWAVGLGGRLWLCSPWRGGWEVRGAPLTSSVPHRPDRHLKPQCKHKGISQNECFQTSPCRDYGAWARVCPKGWCSPWRSCLWPRVKQPEACPESEWRSQVPVCRRASRLSTPCSSHVVCRVLWNLF